MALSFAATSWASVDRFRTGLTLGKRAGGGPVLTGSPSEGKKSYVEERGKAEVEKITNTVLLIWKMVVGYAHPRSWDVAATPSMSTAAP